MLTSSGHPGEDTDDIPRNPNIFWVNTAPLQRELALIYKSMISFKDGVRLQGKYIEKKIFKMKKQKKLADRGGNDAGGGVGASLIKHPVTLGGSTLAAMSSQG